MPQNGPVDKFTRYFKRVAQPAEVIVHLNQRTMNNRIAHHHNALQISTESFDSIVLDHNEGGCHEETGCRSLKYKAPHGHRVRRENTKENMQSCKFSF